MGQWSVWIKHLPGSEPRTRFHHHLFLDSIIVCLFFFFLDFQAISEVFSPAPATKAELRWAESREVEPGDVIPVNVMTEVPTSLTWPVERGALYTVMLLDGGIKRVLPK